MTDRPDQMDRREFLKNSLQVAAGAALIGGGVGCGALRTGKRISLTGSIPARSLGKTGHRVPVLGYGGSAMVDKWSSGYNVKLGSHEDRVAMVRQAYDLGVRYFDTARGYDESEAIMGSALHDVREDVYLATKVAEAQADAVRRSVETSLQELQTDYVDCMQIHSPIMERVGYEGSLRILDELEKLRAQGLFRFIGLTTHVLFETVYRLIETGRFDQVLLARGYMRRGMDMMLSNQNVEWSEKCVAKARELQMGVIAMKVMGLNILGRGGTLVVPDYDSERRRKLPGAAIRWVLGDERISTVIIGMSVPDDVTRNVATVREDLTLTEEDRMLLADYAARAHQSDYVKSMAVV